MGIVHIRADRASVTTMTVTPESMTILDWLLNAGITEERARGHLQAGHVYAGGVQLTDPAAQVGDARIELRIPPIRDEN